MRLQEYNDNGGSATDNVAKTLAVLGTAWGTPLIQSTSNQATSFPELLSLEHATQLATALADIELQPEVSVVRYPSSLGTVTAIFHRQCNL